MRQAGDSGSALAHAEAASLEVTHADVGARLLTRWGVPPNITLAVLLHHQSPSSAAPFERLAATVQLANILAHQMAGDDDTAPDLEHRRQEAMSVLQMAPEDLAPIQEKAHERIGRVWAALQITASPFRATNPGNV
jgi:HD-like signal output (HDOD) protein